MKTLFSRTTVAMWILSYAAISIYAQEFDDLDDLEMPLDRNIAKDKKDKNVINQYNECKNVEIVPHSLWHGRSPKYFTFFEGPQHHIIIAHTVTEECSSKYTCSRIMRTMQDYHMDQLGWGDIGYNFAIGGDGRVYEGTGWTKEGIHTYGWNSKSYGIAFIGDYRTKTPNQAMVQAARSLIVCGIEKGFISVSREVHGARDATCTESPGDELYGIIKQWPRFKGGRLPGYTC